MSIEDQTNNPVCEACGCAGEIGFIIKEGDDVAEVIITANNKALLEAKFNEYLVLAKQVCARVDYSMSPLEEDSTELHAYFKFEVSAEKIIFELKSRSLNR